MNVEDFIQRIGDHNDLVFPAGNSVCFTNIPLQDFHTLEELLKRDIEQINTQLILTLTHMVMSGRVRITGVECAGIIEIVPHCFDNKPSLEICSDFPVRLVFQKTSDMVGYAHDLLREFKRNPASTFSLKPDERLFFCDVTQSELELLKRSKMEFLEWIHTKAPPKIEIIIDGSLGFSPAEIEIDCQSVTALCITTKTGCVFYAQMMG